MTNGNGTPQEGAPPQLNVLAQYTKDLSFENPNAPGSLQPQQQQPRALDHDQRMQVFLRNVDDAEYAGIG